MTRVSLPDALTALQDLLFEKDGKERGITDGFHNSTGQDQARIPLAARLAQERGYYANRVTMIAGDAINAGELIARDYHGAPIRRPFDLPSAVPLAVDLADLKRWLDGWLDRRDTAAILRSLEPPKPQKRGVGRPRSGGPDSKGPDDETMMQHWRDIKSQHSDQGGLAIAQKVIAAHPDQYVDVSPDALRQRYHRHIYKTGQNN